MCFDQAIVGDGLKVYDMFKEGGSVYREEERKREQEREKCTSQTDFAGSIKKMRIKTAQIKAEEAQENTGELKNEQNKKKLNQRLKDSIAYLLDVVVTIKRQNPQNHNVINEHNKQQTSRKTASNQR